MATISEKLRACVTLDEGAFAHVFVCGSKALTLDVNDLTSLADTVELGEQFDFDVSRATGGLTRELDAAKREASEARGQAAALRTEITKLRAQVDERVSVIEAVKWKEETVGALNAGLDAAKTEVAALKAKLEESVGIADPVAWLVGGQSPVVTTSAAAAQLCSEDGLDVVPLYRHPPAAEALPTREDMDVVLRSAFDSGRVRLGADTVLFGERSGLIEVNGRFLEREDKTPATFAQAVKVCADLVRAQEEEG